MSNEQDKYNDYDVDDAFSGSISHSRRRRAAKRNGTGGGTPARHIMAGAQGKEKVKISMAVGADKAVTAQSGVSVPYDKTTEVVAKNVNGSDKPKKKKLSPQLKFLTIVVSIVSVFCIILGGYILYTALDGDPDNNINILNSNIFGSTDEGEEEKETFSQVIPERTQFVIMCTDEDGTRTDTIMVGCYNSVTQGISLISVPRDTIVSVSAADFKTMREEFPEPGKQIMKINALHHYSGDELGPEMLVKYLNELLGTDIQYYVRVDFDAFHYLVDSIGGIEFDVPINMDYDDPTQDLAIHLKAGLQMLDGDKAEQLVRYRKDNYGGGYINGDLGRIEMQQAFMKVLLTKVASVDTIKKNPTAYVNAMFKYVKTNVSVSDAIKYASALNKLDTSKIETYTLPGDVAAIDGISGYEMYSDETAELVYNIFERSIEEILEDTTEETTAGVGDEDSSVSDSKGASIIVRNGGYTSGKAAQVKATLERDGYTVSEIGDYSGEKRSKTRIYVAEDGLGSDLEGYFVNAETMVDSSKTEGYDIMIVVGTGE
jgi:LCP family protein required for cell wall assembly